MNDSRQSTRGRGRLALAAVALAVTTAGLLPGPSQAANRYEFAYGGGEQSRYWQTSQWNPGTCTIQLDYLAATVAAPANRVDGVVLSPSALGIRGTRVNISWGATVVPPSPVGGQLKVRFVKVPGCANSVVTLPAPGGYQVDVPGDADFMVVTATAGTAQVWFTV